MLQLKWPKRPLLFDSHGRYVCQKTVARSIPAILEVIFECFRKFAFFDHFEALRMVKSCRHGRGVNDLGSFLRGSQTSMFTLTRPYRVDLTFGVNRGAHRPKHSSFFDVCENLKCDFCRPGQCFRPSRPFLPLAPTPLTPLTTPP